MNFSLRLKELRESRGLSQVELASIIGVGVSTVGMWESTSRTPGAKTLQKLVKFFNCPVDYLLGYDNELQIINSEAAPKITPLELDLIENFRKLPAQTQDYVVGIVKNLAR